MGSWVLNSQTGGITYQEQPTPESEVERQQRLSNLRNRLSGNAGHGMMFSATNGGVQRTYDPNYSSTNLMKSQPYTTDTGRSYAATDIEKEYGEQLKKIGTSSGAIRDRLQGVYSSVQGINSTLDPYSLKKRTPNLSDVRSNLSYDDVTGILSNEETAGKIRDRLISTAHTEASNIIKERLGNLSSDISSFYSDISPEEEKFKSINLLPTSTGAQTSKESASIREAERRLLSTMFDNSGLSLAGQYNLSKGGIENLYKDLSASENLYKEKEAALKGEGERYGDTEINEVISEIISYRNLINQLKENIANTNFGQLRDYDTFRGRAVQGIKETREDVSNILKQIFGSEEDLQKAKDEIINSRRVIGQKDVGRGLTVPEYNIDAPLYLLDDWATRRLAENVLQDIYYKYTGTGVPTSSYKYWG